MLFLVDMIYLAKQAKRDVEKKELERDVTTSAMAKAILRLKTLVFITS